MDTNKKIDYVYFMQVGDNGPIKIGHTVDLRKRLVVTQVHNPYLVRLLCATDGGFKLEQELHEKFKDSHLFGEWFSPSEEIINYILPFERLNWIAEDLKKAVPRGENHRLWKGENAINSVKQQRARYFTRYKENRQCEKCHKTKNLDTVFKDGNKNNLDKDNLILLCRRCRMFGDGTLQNLMTVTKGRVKIKDTIVQCIICKENKKYFSKGKCLACYRYFEKRGIERSEKKIKTRNQGLCKICNRQCFLERERCHTCSEFLRRNGYDKSEINQENDTTNKIRISESGLEKATLIRKLYIEGMHKKQYLAEISKLSLMSINDIIYNRTWEDTSYIYISPKIVRKQLKERLTNKIN